MKKILFSVISILMVLILTSCESIEYIKIQESQQKDYKKTDFPTTIKFDYFFNVDYPIYGKNKLFIYKKEYVSGKVSYNDYTIYEVKRVKGGYRIIGSEYDKFSVTNPKKLGFSPFIEFSDVNGQFEMDFETYDEYEDFLSRGAINNGWEMICKNQGICKKN